MKAAGICAAFAFGLASAGAAAQGGGDPMEKLRACSLLPQAERLECLDKLSRDIAPTPPPAAPPPAPPPESKRAPAAEDWTVSETTSPLDYTPVAIATASSSGPDGGPLQLSIQCRGGRTELLIGGPAVARRSEEYVVSYAINDGAPVVLPVGMPASGTGVAIRGDVVRLLASLPDRGDVTFRVEVRRGGEALQGRYSLSGLKAVRDRLAAPCRWPAAGVPRN